MTTYVLRNGELVEKSAAPPKAGVQIMLDTKPYKSPTGAGWITSRSHRREDLKRSGSREVDPSEFRAVYQNARFAQKHGLPHTPGPAREAPTREFSDYDLSHLKR